MSRAPRATGARSGPPAWVWVALALCVLTVVNMGFAAGDPLLELSDTSYGRSSNGFGALHDLFSELPARPRSERSLVPYDRLPREATLWLLAPDFLADQGDARDAKGGDDEPDPLVVELQRFVERGGTALLFGTADSDWSRYGLALGAPRQGQNPRVYVPGARALEPRAIGVRGLLHFDPARLGDFARVLGGPHTPYAVEKAIGRGRLIAIADVTPLRNDQLDRADHVLYAADLARAYGPPLFDERCHGMQPSVSLASALGWERSWLLATALALCALLALWHLRSVPASTLAHAGALELGLGGFVDSLAVLYARKAPRDAAAVYRAYLHGVRFRLRHQLYGTRGGSDELLGQRLRRELEGEPELLAGLQGARAPRGERELRAAVRELERGVARVTAHPPSPRARTP